MSSRRSRSAAGRCCARHAGAPRSGPAARAALVLFGVALHGDARQPRRGSTTSCSFRGDAHDALAGPHRPARRRAGCAAGRSACPTTSSIPDARWILDLPRGRGSSRARDRRRRAAQGASCIARPRPHALVQPGARDRHRRPDATRSRRPASSASPTGVLRRVCPLFRRAQRRSQLRPRSRARRERRRRCGASAVGRASLLAARFALRLWGVRHGLPYAYNADENAHFVPRAIGMFGHDLEPAATSSTRRPTRTCCTSSSPSGTAGARAVARRVRDATRRRSSIVARVAARGARARSRSGCSTSPARGCSTARAGLLAAALLAVAFLPVFYSHLALNDVPTLAPLCLALWGAAGVLRHGPRARLRRSPGSGSAWRARRSTRAGIVLLPLLAASAAQLDARPRRRAARPAARRRRGARGVPRRQPVRDLDFDAFHDGLSHQSDASPATRPASSASTQDNGSLYYLWTFDLGAGLGARSSRPSPAPSLLAFATTPRAGLVLVPAPILFVALHGLAGALLRPLAAAGASRSSACSPRLRRRARRRGSRAPARRCAPTLVALVRGRAAAGRGSSTRCTTGACCRARTRATSTRDWMVAHVPAGTKIVVEPVVPDGWAQDIGTPSPVDGRTATAGSSTRRAARAIDPTTGTLLPAPGRAS